MSLPGLAFGLMALAVAVFAWRHRPLVRLVRACEARCCTACLHDLRGLGESGVCPECGAAFGVAADRKAWRRARLLRDGAG